MASNVEPWVVAAIGAIPGVLGLIGAAGTLWRLGARAGRIEQRLTDVEQDVSDMKGMGETLARVDERTRGTQDEMKGLRGAVDRFVEIMLQERRTFAPSEAPPRQRGR